MTYNTSLTDEIMHTMMSLDSQPVPDTIKSYKQVNHIGAYIHCKHRIAIIVHAYDGIHAHFETCVIGKHTRNYLNVKNKCRTLMLKKLMFRAYISIGGPISKHALKLMHFTIHCLIS